VWIFGNIYFIELRAQYNIIHRFLPNSFSIIRDVLEHSRFCHGKFWN